MNNMTHIVIYRAAIAAKILHSSICINMSRITHFTAENLTPKNLLGETFKCFFLMSDLSLDLDRPPESPGTWANVPRQKQNLAVAFDHFLTSWLPNGESFTKHDQSCSNYCRMIVKKTLNSFI